MTTMSVPSPGLYSPKLSCEQWEGDVPSFHLPICCQVLHCLSVLLTPEKGCLSLP